MGAEGVQEAQLCELLDLHQVIVLMVEDVSKESFEGPERHLLGVGVEDIIRHNGTLRRTALEHRLDLNIIGSGLPGYCSSSVVVACQPEF